jgi:thiamine biosynthesis lipoprotein
MWSEWGRLLIGCVAAVLVGCGGKTSEMGWAEAEGLALGMKWKAQVRGVSGETVQQVMEGLCEHWEIATSHWREDSELMKFNAVPAGQWVEVSESLWAAVSLAKQVADETEGALDITLGPLVEAWGFGKESGVQRVLSEAEVRDLRERCGWGLLEMDATGRRLQKRVAGLQLNVAAVVEGLILDEWAQVLQKLGARDYLLEFGGELLAAGESARGGAWRVAVQTPDALEGEAYTMLPLVNSALATSGTYRHRFEKDGQVYSHLLDPQTGRPVVHDLVSVTVMDPRASRADAWATALLVLGPVKGRKVAERLGLRVIWIESGDVKS